MRIVTIGDIGVTNDVIHIGDEAMTHELITQLRRRGIDDIVTISSDPAESGIRYNTSSIHRIGFFTDTNRSRSLAEDRFDRVLRTARGEQGLLGADDSAHQVIAAIASSDGVAIAGGGNIASTWPTHVFERAALGEIARIVGVPLVVTGQTIGPFLTSDDATLVSDLLNSAAVVGLREKDSFEFSLRLGVRDEVLTATIDDASFLGWEAPQAEVHAARPVNPYCVVTMAAHINGEDRTRFEEAMAHLLDAVINETDLDVVFFAHFGSTDTTVSIGDTLVHEAILAKMTSSRAQIVPTTDSPAAAHIARGAALSISSRYHPAVFAVSAGVPTIGISVDDYTHTKLTGALGNFGQTAVLPLSELLAGSGPALATEVWNSRELIRTQGQQTTAVNRERSSAWWDRVAATFQPRS